MSRIGRSPSIAAVELDARRPRRPARTSGRRRATRTLGVGRLAVERERPGLGQGERPQVVDQPGQHARLVEDDREMRRVGRVDAVDDRLEVALDDGQRRPQLVADRRPAGSAAGARRSRAARPSCRSPRPAGGRRRRPRGFGADADRVVAGLDPRGWPRRARSRVAADDRNARPTPTRIAATTTRTMSAASPSEVREDERRSPRRATRRRAGRRARRRSRSRAVDPQRRPPAHGGRGHRLASGPQRGSSAVEPVRVAGSVGSSAGRGHQSAARSSAKR